MIPVLLLLLLLTTSIEARIYQPQFVWADGKVTEQGTGSFVRSPNGETVGLTSIHFLDFSGPELSEVRWLGLQSRELVAISTRRFGKPGQGGNFRTLDLRFDYFMAAVESAADLFELDKRSRPMVGERICFEDNFGGEPVEGKVIETRETYIALLLDKEVVLRSRSGTPVISRETGRIIGILAGGKGRMIYLTPAASICAAMVEPTAWIREKKLAS